MTRFKEALQVDNLVLIQEDNLRLEWPLAVVTKLHLGSNGIVRSVTLKTAKGELSRAVQILHNLEVCDENTTAEQQMWSLKRIPSLVFL
jgi:hypothetical protein